MYFYRRAPLTGGKAIYLHRELMNVSGKLQVDHANHNYLDLRKSELRPATQRQNNQNSRKAIGGKYTSRYKGVSWNPTRGKWWAAIVFNGETISLGYYDSEVEAAQRYDAKAIELFKDFASLNFPIDADR